MVLASPTEIFFTSYMGEKSKAVGNRSQLKRAMLGIAAATCSNKKHGVHLQPMGNCILGHCNSWDLWGHAQRGYYESKYSPQAHKEEAQKLTSACFYISLVRIMLADKWCRKVNCSRTRKSHLKVQRIIIASVEKKSVNHWLFLLPKYASLGHTSPFTNSQELNKIHHWMICYRSL